MRNFFVAKNVMTMTMMCMQGMCMFCYAFVSDVLSGKSFQMTTI